jgi:hypothetical protein
MPASRIPTVRFLTLAAAAATLAACGGADTAADKVDTTGVTAVGSGTGAGDSARAGGVSGTFMGDTTRRDSIVGGDTTRRDTSTATRAPR